MSGASIQTRNVRDCIIHRTCFLSPVFSAQMPLSGVWKGFQSTRQPWSTHAYSQGLYGIDSLQMVFGSNFPLLYLMFLLVLFWMDLRGHGYFTFFCTLDGALAPTPLFPHLFHLSFFNVLPLTVSPHRTSFGLAVVEPNCYPSARSLCDPRLIMIHPSSSESLFSFFELDRSILFADFFTLQNDSART